MSRRITKQTRHSMQKHQKMDATNVKGHQGRVQTRPTAATRLADENDRKAFCKPRVVKASE